MASSLYLYDNGETPLTLNLISGSGFNSVYDTFKQAVSVDGRSSVIDTFQVSLQAASGDLLASQIIALGRMLKWGEQYKQDDTQQQEVLLYSKLDDETNTRYALVLGGSYSFNSGWMTPQTVSAHIAYLTVTIEHTPWEASGYTISANGVSSLGGLINISSGVIGDTPGRAHMIFTNNPANGTTIDTL